jgi:hypothetical protein
MQREEPPSFLSVFCYWVLFTTPESPCQLNIIPVESRDQESVYKRIIGWVNGQTMHATGNLCLLALPIPQYYRRHPDGSPGFRSADDDFESSFGISITDSEQAMKGCRERLHSTADRVVATRV